MIWSDGGEWKETKNQIAVLCAFSHSCWLARENDDAKSDLSRAEPTRAESRSESLQVVSIYFSLVWFNSVELHEPVASKAKLKAKASGGCDGARHSRGLA